MTGKACGHSISASPPSKVNRVNDGKNPPFFSSMWYSLCRVWTYSTSNSFLNSLILTLGTGICYFLVHWCAVFAYSKWCIRTCDFWSMWSSTLTLSSPVCRGLMELQYATMKSYDMFIFVIATFVVHLFSKTAFTPPASTRYPTHFSYPRSPSHTPRDIPPPPHHTPSTP